LVIEKSIKARSDELKAIINKECADLLQSLNDFKDERLKMIQTRFDELALQRMLADSYNLYLEELLNKWSPYDISRCGKDLLARSDEISKSHQRFNNTKITEADINFKKSDITDISHGHRKLIGSLQINDGKKVGRVSDL